jgi:carbon-monoxide dehydrogenase large subunit
MTAFVLGLPEHKVRVIAPDVGGGFGSKIYLYAEETAMVWASKRVGRPIKWVAERSESFLSDAHGRDHVTRAELALDKDGKFLALRVNTIAAMGAYLSTFASCIPTILYATLLAGSTRRRRSTASDGRVFTNTAPVDAYRARVAPRQLRRRADRPSGRRPSSAFRRTSFAAQLHPHVPVSDAGRAALRHGGYDAMPRRGDEMADVEGYPARKAEARSAASCAGWIRVVHRRPADRAVERRGALGARAGLCSRRRVRVHPPGSVTVFTGSHSHGQGHETTFAQVVATRPRHPGRERRRRSRRHGPRAVRHGHVRSRSLAAGGTAMSRRSTRSSPRARRSPRICSKRGADIEFKDGKFTVGGHRPQQDVRRDRADAVRAAQLSARQAGAGLDETAFYDPTNFTFPAGTHICEVEIDPDTGRREIVNFSACDDFGNIINPMIVEGQVHGGPHARDRPGAARALRLRRGQRPAPDGSLMDYALPRADDVPSFKVAPSHAVHAQSARRKGLRRSGRDRRAGRADERRSRRARAVGRQAFRHAGIAASRVAGDQRRQGNA